MKIKPIFVIQSNYQTLSERFRTNMREFVNLIRNSFMISFTLYNDFTQFR